jgi:uncharacterized membrane protein
MSASRFVRLHPRLIFAIGLGLATFLFAPPEGNVLTRSLVAWNAGCWCWVVLMAFMMARNDAMHLRKIARQEDVGAWLALAFVCAAAAVSIVAIVFELAHGHESSRFFTPFHYLMAGATVMGSWLAVGVAFTSHYAHLYYSMPHAQRPLRFPEDPPEPNYWDFLYFSFTISVAAQTSDVCVMTTAMRRIVVAHEVLGFIFNAAIIGFTINVFAGAVGH